ncbi:hypothetical protein V5799_025399 [Amblyomma americanum]|uniref:Uncharacterized protein n=1 Tax=Amblyomma americanum TaxID=6943 RepID=A0AAQ4E9P6_AMBAM
MLSNVVPQGLRPPLSAVPQSRELWPFFAVPLRDAFNRSLTLSSEGTTSFAPPVVNDSSMTGIARRRHRAFVRCLLRHESLQTRRHR